MTSEDIRKVTFEKGVRGYRAEDVDDFLQQVAKEFDALEAELQEAIADKDAAENKMYILAEKVEEYRGQEDTLKTALINAQRMGETVVHEAKQKADSMVREATGKAQLLREHAEAEIMHEQHALEQMKEEVTRFKATILNLYKQHIESLSALDAPVEQAGEFLSEHGRYPQAAAEEPEYQQEPEVETYAPEEMPDANFAPTEGEPRSTFSDEVLVQPGQALDLFDGVPIDEDL